MAVTGRTEVVRIGTTRNVHDVQSNVKTAYNPPPFALFCTGAPLLPWIPAARLSIRSVLLFHCLCTVNCCSTDHFHDTKTALTAAHLCRPSSQLFKLGCARAAVSPDRRAARWATSAWATLRTLSLSFTLPPSPAGRAVVLTKGTPSADTPFPPLSSPAERQKPDALARRATMSISGGSVVLQQGNTCILSRARI